MAVVADLSGSIQARPPTRVPLGVQVAECFDDCRALLGPGYASDEMLHRLRRASRPDELHDASVALQRAIHDVGDRLATPSGGTSGVKARRLKDLRAEMLALVVRIQQRLFDRQQDMIKGVGEGLHRLAACETTSQMIERSTLEVCRSCGVDRCALFRTDGARLYLESVHFAEDRAFEEQWRAYAVGHPAELKHQDAEVQALRRRTAVMVLDPDHFDGMRELLDAGRATNYIAVPVIVRGSVVGMLHADRYFSGARVDPVARDVLATFAAGLGLALERNVLTDRTRSQLRNVREMIAQVDASMDDLFHAGVSLRREERNQIDPATRTPVVPLAAESRISGLLTRRELEVMELMARGASNGDIADRLVVSEGTVKSHVKHILRKLHATNRAQAVSTYMRIQNATRAG
jgi:DNA-binding CsgD family transcriptional regulator